VVDAFAFEDAVLPAFAELLPPDPVALAPAEAFAPAFAPPAPAGDPLPAEASADVFADVLADAVATPFTSTEALADDMLLEVAPDDEEPLLAVPDAVAVALADAATETPAGADRTSANARLIVCTLVTVRSKMSDMIV
jgi:hypothetical protein